MDKGTMQILVITQDAPGAGWEGKDEILRDEARHVWALQQQGVIRSIWFTDPGRDAVILMECESIQAARKIVDDFPLVRHGLIVYTATGLTPYDGYERLFRT
jgi:hypothetical protein